MFLMSGSFVLPIFLVLMENTSISRTRSSTQHSCPECARPVGAPQHSGPSNEKAMTHWAFIVVIGATVSVVFVLGMVTSYKLWQKRKRQQEQARFLRLFEGDDDVDDEFRFIPLSHVTQKCIHFLLGMHHHLINLLEFSFP